MASSPKEPPSVDPSSCDAPEANADEAQRPARRRRSRDHGDPSQGRYSPVVLVMDVVRLLHGQGVAVSEAVDRLHEAVEASTDLLRCVGVVPDTGVITRSREHTAELVAAAVLMRAAGIEPNTVKTWPRRSA
jgi:hypothetical protein